METVGNFTVYMHTNKINNKVYVGITQRDPKLRWLSGHGYPHNPHFNSAIKKYGWDNFEHIVFAENLSEEDACRMEKLLIKFYDTTNREYGYNMSTGGEFGGTGVKRSAESRKKMSEAAKRKPPMSKETIEKIRIANTGKKRSDEIRKKFSKIQKGRKGTPWTEDMHQLFDKPVLQYTKDGVFICEHSSIHKAGETVGISETAISASCRGAIPSAGGFLWRFKENNDFPFKIEPFVNKQFVPVRQYDLDGNFVAEYKTSKEAERITGINYKDINSVINEKDKKSAGGYMWRRASEYADVEKINPYIPFAKPGHPVVQLTLNDEYIAEYQGIRDAQKALNMPNIHIGECCRGNRPHAGGYHWRYKDEYEKELNNENTQQND